MTVVIDKAGQDVRILWGDGHAYWEARNFLCKIIPAVIRKLAERTHGCPSELYVEAIRDLFGFEMVEPIVWYFDDNVEMALLASAEAQRRWREILEKIAIGFEYYDCDDYCDSIELEQPIPFIQARVDEAHQLFQRWFTHLWD